MSLRSCVIVIVVLFVVSAGGSLGLAQQDANNQEQPLMTPASSPSAPATEEPVDPRKLLVDRLHLRIYEAAAGDFSLCADDKYCSKEAKTIKSWRCAADVSNGTDKSKNPFDCFEGTADKYSKEDQAKIASSFRSLIGSPSAITRQAFLSYSLGAATEDFIVEQGAYYMVSKGSAESCENYIKDYVGAYGPQWKPDWYKALSGCRILAGKSTREQEEKDFYTWFGVVQGSGNCSDIVNSEMQKACNAPGAASPMPSPPASSVQAQ